MNKIREDKNYIEVELLENDIAIPLQDSKRIKICYSKDGRVSESFFLKQGDERVES
jgi:hypothetical protein